MFYYRINQKIKGNHRKTSQYNQHIEPQGHFVIITSNKTLNESGNNKERHRTQEQRYPLTKSNLEGEQARIGLRKEHPPCKDKTRGNRNHNTEYLHSPM